ncbi:MAG: metallophosphoesterase family protein [Pseudomonadota bacterium]
MLGKLFQKKGAAEAPAGKRIYAVGDIHGCLEELNSLLDKIQEDNKAASVFQTSGSNDRQQHTTSLIFLGDYVDRGPDSRGVIERLIALKKHAPDTVFLKGNHEALMLDYLSNPHETEHWLDWGGEETLKSYGVSPVAGRTNDDLAATLKDKLPESHASFLQSLNLIHLEGDYLFVHAGLRPGVALHDQQEEDLLWVRKKFHKMNASDRPEQVVVHGHQPVEKPLDAGWRIDVDTGACWSGRLTAVVLEETSRRFLST